MATWKKLVVSGSAISQLNNDAGYLTAGTITQANGYATASVGGTQLIASSATASLTFASSSGQGVTLAGSSPGGLNTITVGLSNVPNTSLANSSSTIGTTNIQLGATVSTLDGLTSVTATNFTGTASYATNANQLDGLDSTAFVLNSQTSSMNVLSASYALNSTTASYALNSTSASYALNADLLDGLNSTAFVLNSQTSSMTVLSSSFAINASSSLSAVSSSYALTASFALNAPTATNALTASNITPAITAGNTNNRVLTANGDGTLTGEANLTFDGSLLNLTGNQTISGNLTVFGTASFQNTENLLVADRFVLLASGSTTDGPGGIVVQQTNQNIGELFGWDSGADRWAVTGSYNANQSVFTPDAFMAAAINLSSTDPNITPPDSKYNKKGNIYVSSTANEDIWIYS